MSTKQFSLVALALATLGLMVYLSTRNPGPKNSEQVEIQKASVVPQTTKSQAVSDSLRERVASLEARLKILQNAKAENDTVVDMTLLRTDLARKNLLDWEEKYGPKCHVAPPNIKAECWRLSELAGR